MKISQRLSSKFLKRKILSKRDNSKLIKHMMMPVNLHDTTQIEYNNGFKMPSLIQLSSANSNDTNSKKNSKGAPK
jgi:hypothetical protein